MLGRLFKGEPEGAAQKPKKKRRDKAIVHKSVPEEVLYPNGRPEEVHDNGWLDEVPVPKSKPANAAPATPAPAARQAPEPTPARVPAQAAAPAPAAQAVPVAAPTAVSASAFTASANAATTGRPRYPHGWMVVVEGPGLGEWFPLEGGVSTIGSGSDQTISLAFGDVAIAESAHATLAYDKTAHCFALNPGDKVARINGLPASGPTTLRDGDVMTLGGTSLKLIALCSPNFHWSHVTG